MELKDICQDLKQKKYTNFNVKITYIGECSITWGNVYANQCMIGYLTILIGYFWIYGAFFFLIMILKIKFPLHQVESAWKHILNIFLLCIVSAWKQILNIY